MMVARAYNYSAKWDVILAKAVMTAQANSTFWVQN